MIIKEEIKKMNKKIWLMTFLLFGIASVNASLGNCDVNGDNEINIIDLAYIVKIQNWYQEKDIKFDLNNDEKINLADLSLYTTNYETKRWCNSKFWQHLEPQETITSENNHPTSNHKSEYPNLLNKAYVTMTLTDYPQQFRIGTERYYAAYQKGKLVVGEWRFYKTILKRTTFEEIGVEYDLEKISRYIPTRYRPELVKVKLYNE